MSARPSPTPTTTPRRRPRPPPLRRPRRRPPPTPTGARRSPATRRRVNKTRNRAGPPRPDLTEKAIRGDSAGSVTDARGPYHDERPARVAVGCGFTDGRTDHRLP